MKKNYIGFFSGFCFYGIYTILNTKYQIKKIENELQSDRRRYKGFNGL